MKILGFVHKREGKVRHIENERPRMLQYACYYLGNRADAEDVVQDAFVRLHQRMSQGELEERNLIGYLYRTLSNLCVSRLREAGRLRMVPLEGQPEPMEPEAEFQEQEYQRICQLLDKIPSEQAEIIRLRYYGDKSFRGLRPCAPPDSLPYRGRSGGGSIQAHVPLQCLGSVQVEALRPPPRTRQPPEPASLRLHRLRRHQHLHLRLWPLRQDRHAESHLQPSELDRLTLASPSSLATRPNERVRWLSLLFRFENAQTGLAFCSVCTIFNLRF